MKTERDFNREQSLDPEWRAAVDEGLDTSFEMYELLGAPIVTAPFDISRSQDGKTIKDSDLYADIHRGKQRYLLDGLFSRVGFDPENAIEIGRYTFQIPLAEARAEGIIYDTERRDEDMFVHRTRTVNTVDDWFVASKDFRP